MYKDMGSIPSTEQRTSKQISDLIDADLNTEKRKIEKTIKLLILGPSNSGKSTVLKQMKLLNNSFKEDELMTFRGIVHNNVVQSMGTLVESMPNYGFEYEDPDRRIDGLLVIKTIKINDTENITQELYESLAALWADRGIRKCYFEKASELHLSESVEYFFEKMETIVQPGYIPTVQDVLFSRVSTVGVVESIFSYKDLSFRVIDVGGQQSERKKWIHCFADVTGILFIAAINEYDKNLQEDRKTNRMHDSLKLFDEIIHLEWFFNTSIILFLNKKDLFGEKIIKVPLTIAFPGYRGESNYQPAVEYIVKKFRKTNRNPNKNIYIHETCATDTSQFQFVLHAAMDTITSTHLKEWGLF